MTNEVFIVGCSNEALNAAIAMASINKSVTLIAGQAQIAETLNHYRFERQTVALWDLYTKENKIIVREDMAVTLQQLASNEVYNHATFWFFLDVLDNTIQQLITQYFVTPHYNIILSGTCAIGNASRLAEQLATSHVFYFPIIFIKDGISFSSILNPDYMLLGEKVVDHHQHCDVICFFLNRVKKSFTADIKTIEFSRSTIMTMLATRLSFMNELARLADRIGVDICAVQKIVSLDNRVGQDYLSAGWGFGGKSLPNELKLLMDEYAQHNVKNSLIQSVISINEDQKELIFRKFWRHFEGFIEGKTVVIWGAGYRSGTGRTTNSAIHPLLKLLWSYQIHTKVFATNTAYELQEQYQANPLFELVDEAYKPLQTADALFILNWSALNKPDQYLLNRAAIPIFDARNIIDNQTKSQLTAAYYGIGRNKG